MLHTKIRCLFSNCAVESYHLVSLCERTKHISRQSQEDSQSEPKPESSFEPIINATFENIVSPKEKKEVSEEEHNKTCLSSIEEKCLNSFKRLKESKCTMLQNRQTEKVKNCASLS